MAKRPSTYLDFELYTSKKEALEEFGISKKKTKKVTTTVSFLVCPLCGLHKRMGRTGMHFIIKMKRYGKRAKEVAEKLVETKEIVGSRAREYNPHKEDSFSLVDLKEAPFVSIREARGRGKGMPEIAIIRISDIPNLPAADRKILIPLLLQARDKCQEIIKEVEAVIP
ncbi:MAG: hypothetical protein K6T73_01100 [Candidatus Bathyarchaeota archaeon]|nr:hypothetical protein [Candidatus Bathyarchaeota archaeon]